MAQSKKPPDPFRWFGSSPDVIRLVMMMYARYPLSLRNIEDLLVERGIHIRRSEFARCATSTIGDGISTRVVTTIGVAETVNE